MLIRSINAPNNEELPIIRSFETGENSNWILLQYSNAFGPMISVKSGILILPSIDRWYY